MISFFIMFSCFFYLSNYRSDKISVLKPKNGLANKWINTILETTICQIYCKINTIFIYEQKMAVN